MERLKRWREPAAVIALVGLALHVVVLLLAAVTSPADLDLLAPELAYALVVPVLLLLLTALVVACWVAEPIPHARGLAIAALVLVAVTVVGAAAFAVAAVVLGPTYVWSVFTLRAVSPLVVTVVALGALVALVRRPLQATAPVPELESPEPEPEPVDPQREPEWTPDAAVGTVWRRAGDATSQGPATSWDAPGASGWSEPGPRAEIPTEPTRRTED